MIVQSAQPIKNAEVRIDAIDPIPTQRLDNDPRCVGRLSLPPSSTSVTFDCNSLLRTPKTWWTVSVARELASVKRANILKDEVGIGRKKKDILFDEAMKLFLAWGHANRRRASPWLPIV